MESPNNYNESTFTTVTLKPEDVRGATFVFPNVGDHTVLQLKRWLTCRGLPVGGDKKILIKRCEDAIAAGQESFIDVAVDGGSHYKRLRDAVNTAIPVTSRAPIIPVVGWNTFPSKNIPEHFNQGLIYHYIVETHPTCAITGPDSDGEMEILGDSDASTAKPLKRGSQYVKSEHVVSMMDTSSADFYFVKCFVHSSFHSNVSYCVTVTISQHAGTVREGTCECKQRILGRCSHVAALLLKIIDHVNQQGYSAVSCTGRARAWGRGSNARNPQAIRRADYPSRASISAKAFRDPRAHRHQNIVTATDSGNELLAKLQLVGEENCWENLLTIVYPDLPISDEYRNHIAALCLLFIENLNEMPPSLSNPAFLIPGTEMQSGSDIWKYTRSWMITASNAKRFLTLTKSSAKRNALCELLWMTKTFPPSEPMKYGTRNEEKARKAYISYQQSVDPSTEVGVTGLWASCTHPMLGCSVDGIVTTEHKGVKILEIKCPYTLRDADPRLFSQVLTSKQKAAFVLEDMGNCNYRVKTTHTYYFQMQMCMGIHDIHDCDLFIWSAKGFICVPVKFDPVFWKDMEQKLVSIHKALIISEWFAMRAPRRLDPIELNF